jgi:hypothetical protein
MFYTFSYNKLIECSISLPEVLQQKNTYTSWTKHVKNSGRMGDNSVKKLVLLETIVLSQFVTFPEHFVLPFCFVNTK